MDRTEPASLPRAESQSRLSPVLLWVLLGAAVFRIVTAVLDRAPADAGGGLVSWQPREKAAALAVASRRPVLYDFTAAWCGPCHMLDRDWSDAGIAESVNSDFVPARVVDRQREDGRNPPDIEELHRRFGISAFPTLVATTPDGRVLGKLEGYPGREGLVKFLADSRAHAGSP